MEFHTPIVICDGCHPNEDILILDGQLVKCDPAHGYSVGFSTEMMYEHGWESRDFGIICPTCVVNEAATQKLDEDTDAYHGATGFSNLLRPDQTMDTQVEAEAAAIEVEKLVERERELSAAAKEMYPEQAGDFTETHAAFIREVALTNLPKEQ